MAHVDQTDVRSRATSAEGSKAAVRPRRWARRALLLVVLACAAVWFAPSIVAVTSLRDTLLNMALTHGESIRTGGGSLGWLSPIEITDVRLYDRQGELLAVAPSIRLERPLIDLAIDPNRVGTVRVERPEMHVALRSGGSNWEDFLAPWLAPSDEPGGPITVAVEVVDGRAVIVDAVAGRQWKATSVTVSFSMSGDAAIKIDANATLVEDAAAAGSQAGRLEIHVDTQGTEGTAGSLTVLADAVPLSLGESLLARFVPGARLSGRLTSNISLTWSEAGGKLQARVGGEATVENLVVTAGGLGDDQIALARLDIAPMAVAWQDNRLAIEQLDVACDLGRLSIEGAVGTEAVVTGNALAALVAAARENYRIDARVDLARLAAMLPGMLRVREGTVITGGELKVALESTGGEDGHLWQGSLETNALTATSQGRPLVWERPVEIKWTVRSTAAGFVVDELVCQSDFLQLRGDGTRDAITATATYDLTRLAENLGQLIDFGGWQITGQGDARLAFRREAEGRFRADVTAALERFQLTHPERTPWSEERMSLEASAVGTLAGTSLSRIESATAEVLLGDDKISARLVEGVSIGESQQSWPLEIRWEGRLAGWAPRLAPWVSLGDWMPHGIGRLAAVADISAGGVNIRQAKLSVEQFQLRAAGLTIDEPRVELEGTARWDQNAGRLDVAGAKLTSAALSLQADQATLLVSDSRPVTISGNFSYEGALDQIFRWTVDPERPAPWWPVGKVAGQATLNHGGGKTDAHVELTVRDGGLYEYAPAAAGGSPYRLAWREPELALSADVGYDTATDSLRIDRSQLRSGIINATAAGTILAVATEQQLDLAGTLDYDLEKISPLVRSYLGTDVRLVGRDRATWNVRGPLSAARAEVGEPAIGWSRRLTGQAGFAWQGAEVYGLSLGPGRLDATLGEGTLRAAPLDVAVLEGRLSATPTVRIDPGPMELLLPAGPLVTNVRITPEVADRALKFIAPVLADATRTEGRFSVTLEATRVPLDDPVRTRLAGRLAIEQVRVTPGPLAQQFIQIGQQIEAIVRRRAPATGGSSGELLTIDNQDVEFQMVDGRVYHRWLEMTVGREVRVRTSGWVGVDESLGILVEVPILDEWIGSEPLLEGLRNQTLRIPIGGTFARPQVDGRAMAQLSEQLIGGAVRSAIGNEINRQLDKLLRPR